MVAHEWRSSEECRNNEERCNTGGWCNTEEWLTVTDGATVTNGAAALMNGAPRCFYYWNPVVLELTNGNLRSSYGSWPVSEVRSLWKNTAHI